jgi:tRNA pseudouridine38-40 synthase
VPNCLLTIAYDGTRFLGWQRQQDQRTVQGELERACARIFGCHVHVEGASRTDAGVHALGMAAHAQLPRPFPLPQLAKALNGNLPDDVVVRSVAAVPDGFHARFDAVGKRYLYRCVVGRLRPPFGRDYCHWVRRPVDLPAMRQAAAALIGRHDFASFASNPGYERRRGTVRTVQHLHLVARRHGFDLAIQGDGFLYNMVRAITGTLLLVGHGRMPAETVAQILAARDRRLAGATAPASGLWLLRVLYARDALAPGDPGPSAVQPTAMRVQESE